MIFFDGREHPHYARPLSAESDLRVVAVMNFYTESYPESTRPPELNRHLFRQALTAKSRPARRERGPAPSRPTCR